MAAVVMEVLRRLRVLCLIAILGGCLASLDQTESQHQFLSLYNGWTHERSRATDD